MNFFKFHLTSVSNLHHSFLLACILMSVSNTAIGQNIHFTDLALKSYLTSEICVDTNQDGAYDITADINSNGEIEFSEALAIFDLRVRDYYPNIYSIKSVKELSEFKSLKRLSIISNYSIETISKLGLDSLEFLWIGTGSDLKRIDISDLPAIFDLRIEDIDSLDYLNLKNGSLAQGIFSLFYTENILEACVDSIAHEYNEVAWRMIDKTPDLECELNTGIETYESNFNIFPNPTTGPIHVISQNNNNSLSLYDLRGKLIYKQQFSDKSFSLDLRPYAKNGLFIIKVASENDVFIERLIIRH